VDSHQSVAAVIGQDAVVIVAKTLIIFKNQSC